MSGSSSRGADRGYDGCTSVDIDAQENVYTGGYFGSIPTLGNANFFFGAQSTTAVGGFGFSNFFFAKINPQGTVNWLRSSGGGLPSVVNNICLYNDTMVVLAGRYSDNANVGGIPLPLSPSTYSNFIGTVDTGGTGRTAFRSNADNMFLSLKKSGSYVYGVDNKAGGVFNVMKFHPDSGILFVDTINISASSFGSFDIIPPSQNCGQMKVCGTYYDYVKYHGVDILTLPTPQATIDYFYGYYDGSGQLLNKPTISSATSVVCNNSDVLITTLADPNVIQYNWQINPQGAATMNVTGNSLLLTLNPNYTGPLYVNCFTTNFCSRSQLSDTLLLNVAANPVVSSITTNGSAVNCVVSTSGVFSWLYNGIPILFDDQTSIPCVGSGDYTVIAINPSGCSDTLTQFITCTTSINENASDKITVGPSPAGSILFVKGISSKAKFILTDTKGSIVLETITEENKEIQLGQLPDGIYGFRVLENDKVFSGKLTVIR